MLQHEVETEKPGGAAGRKALPGVARYVARGGCGAAGGRVPYTIAAREDRDPSPPPPVPLASDGVPHKSGAENFSKFQSVFNVSGHTLLPNPVIPFRGSVDQGVFHEEFFLGVILGIILGVLLGSFS